MKIMLVKDRNVLNTKFLAQFANSLAELGHDVHIVCDSYRKQGNGVTLDHRVQFTNLSGKTNSPITNLFRYIRSELLSPKGRYRKIIRTEKPDLMICYFAKDLKNACGWMKGALPAIQMFHCYPPLMIQNLRKKSQRRYTQIMDLFQRCAALQVLNPGFVTPLSQLCSHSNVVAIPNAVVQIPPTERADLANEKNRIIYVARLDKGGKRQHLLIDAFATASQNIPGWTLEFWGLEKSEQYKQELLAQAQALGVGKQVFIQGYNPNIEEVYRSADINAFPSLVEGFGLALADGMAMGLPSIGFQECPSVNELIKDGENGFLASDPADFASKLETLMKDQSLRIQMGHQAVESVQPFSPQRIAKQWDKLIHSVVQSGKISHS